MTSWRHSSCPTVVAVVVRVHQRAQREAGLAANGIVEHAAPALREAGVDDRDAVAAHEEARVVQPPASVQLDIGEYPIADLLHPRRGQFGVLRYLGCAHGSAPPCGSIRS